MSIELGGSRLVAAVVSVLGVLAVIALAGSAAEGVAAAIGSVGAIAYAAYVSAREWRRPPVRLDFLGDGRVLADGREVDGVSLAWQGPVAILDGRVGRRRVRFLGWPDRIDAATRRELRLWALEASTARQPAAMAP